MSTPYPTSLDDGTTLPYPSSTDTLSSPNLASGQDNQNDSVIAIETLLGTNSTQTSPVANTVLTSPSNGTNEWQSITSAFVSGSTGTGNFVLASSPTISSPTISSPTISSPTITGSLGNISAGTITASGLITANNGLDVSSGTLTLPNNSITATNLATSTILLGSSQITSNQTLTATTLTALPGFTNLTITVPAGGRSVKLTLFGRDVYGETSFITFSIWDNATVGSGTQRGGCQAASGSASISAQINATYIYTPAAGSITYSVGYQCDASGSYTLEATDGYPFLLLAELI